MKRLLTAPIAVLFALGMLAAGDSPPVTKAAKEEMAKLQGTWKVISAEVAGKDTPPAALGMEEVVLKGDKMTLKRDGKEVVTWGFRVDPGKKPPQMDWQTPGDKGPWPGIYALKGDELRLCFPMAPKKGQKVTITISRPENFDTREKPIFLIVARRAKP